MASEASDDDSYLYILADNDVASNALNKKIGTLEIKGDLVGKLLNDRILVIKNFTKIEGLLGGTEIDAILRHTDDNYDYYEVLSKSGGTLDQSFHALVQGKDMQYRLKGIGVNKDGTFKMDIDAQLKAGQSMQFDKIKEVLSIGV